MPEPQAAQPGGERERGMATDAQGRGGWAGSAAGGLRWAPIPAPPRGPAPAAPASRRAASKRPERSNAYPSRGKCPTGRHTPWRSAALRKRSPHVRQSACPAPDGSRGMCPRQAGKKAAGSVVPTVAGASGDGSTWSVGRAHAISAPRRARSLRGTHARRSASRGVVLRYRAPGAGGRPQAVRADHEPAAGARMASRHPLHVVQRRVSAPTSC